MAARLLDWGEESEAGPQAVMTFDSGCATKIPGRFQYFQICTTSLVH